jgi:hypothetical protein
MAGRSLPSGVARARLALALPLVLVAALALPTVANAAVSKSYDFTGIEVWATSTVGTFTGSATGSRHDSAWWRASVEHTVETQPIGYITGGYAALNTSDGTDVRGDFSGGTLTLVSTGTGSCGNLTHDIDGILANVVRSDSDRIGTGTFVGTLIHYRISLLGGCYIYSATVSGTITLSFH